VFPVELAAQTINVHGHTTKMHVSQFPVKLNFAWTCHKLQGKTEDRVILGCTNRILNYNYTAFSRIRSLAALFVLKGVKLTLDILKSPMRQVRHARRRNGSVDNPLIDDISTDATDPAAVNLILSSTARPSSRHTDTKHTPSALRTSLRIKKP
jgi:hypothetical protein